VNAMSRRKNPGEKRREFIQAAEELFLEKGYENTSVDDIVKRMGVAKGLFYYYFESKDEIILAISDIMFTEITQNIDHIMEQPGLTALQRFTELGRSQQYAMKRSLFMKEFFHLERNRNLHYAMEERVNVIMTPVFERIISQGIEEGIFSTPYPKETAGALLSFFSGLGREKMHHLDKKELPHIMGFVQLTMERMLAAPSGTFVKVFEELPPEI
jgi:AcrR family transcriptional regulator